MRKTTFVRTLSFCVSLFCLVALAIIWRPAFAQDATPAAAPAKEAPAVTMPKDPKELMLLAAKTNGLTGDDVQPWHLKASWKMLDEKGGTKDQGKWEEFWVNDKKYKSIFTGGDSTNTEYGTETGILVSGPQNSLPDPITQLRDGFIGSKISPETIQRTNFDLKQRAIGGVNYDCLCQITSAGFHFGTTWCLDTGKSILRITATPQGAQVIHNNLVRFQERYIAKYLEFFQQTKLIMTAHIDSIEPLETIDEAVFLPPADATPKRQIFALSAAITKGVLVKQVDPVYPVFAKNAKIAGDVVLFATINKNGRVEDLHVISGPPQLQQAALDAVKQWVYKPYRLYGETVEVKTTIVVNFGIDDTPFRGR
jgi:TonB family protein